MTTTEAVPTPAGEDSVDGHDATSGDPHASVFFADAEGEVHIEEVAGTRIRVVRRDRPRNRFTGSAFAPADEDFDMPREVVDSAYRSRLMRAAQIARRVAAGQQEQRSVSEGIVTAP